MPKFIYHQSTPMPRETKPPAVKPVDDAIEPDKPVVRLVKDEVTLADEDIVRLEGNQVRVIKDDIIREERIMRLEKDEIVLKVVRERVKAPPVPEARLEVPDTSDAEAKRSHEPGVEAIIEAPAVDSLTGEAVWGKDEIRRPLPWGWFVLLALILAGAVAWSVHTILEAREVIIQERQEIVTALAESEATDEELADNLERLNASVRAYCEARTMEELAGVVRHRERVWPLMRDFYQRTPFQRLGYQRYRSVQATLLDSGKPFWIASVDIGDGSAKQLLVEEVGDGVFKVDWETAVTYQPMSWDDYALDRPADTLLDFRVAVVEDNFFSHEFADSNRWASFRLTVPGSTEFLWGYAPREGETEQLLRRVLEAGGPGRPANMILRLGLPAGMASRRGVVIDKVLSTRWVFIVPPE